MKLSVMIYSFSRTLLSRQMSLPEVLKIISRLGEMSARGYNSYLAFEYEGEANSQDAVHRGITYLRSVLRGLQ